MVNGLAVLGWGVGGIEAEAAMLGQPVSMLIPEVIGFKLHGQMKEGTTATDLVLTVTQMLRKKGVVNKFVEFYGPGVSALALADRATLANMAPEYGATCGFFPIDKETIRYLTLTGRTDERIALVEAYAKAQGMWRDETTPDPIFTDSLSLDLSEVEPSLAGPRRPQDKVLLSGAAKAFVGELEKFGVPANEVTKRVPVAGTNYTLGHGDVVVAAITSCTNTSNPSVMLAAGLLARKAVAKGLKVKPWVKTSLAPGSQVVTEYYKAAGLWGDLDALGFNLVGYGCTTCIGNTGPLPDAISAAINDNNLVAAAVLSGNRNFEARIHQDVRANYLASPPLVVAYAIAGSLWPTNEEIAETVASSISRAMFIDRYSDVFQGPKQWRDVTFAGGQTYVWDAGSTYVQEPPFFQTMTAEPAPIEDVKGARLLALLGDSITTDHISPAGNIKKSGPAGEYLLEHQVRPDAFNSYGSRRGNHEVMMRGTFANTRIKNEMVPGIEGGITKHMPDGTVMPI
jgi:aconitate hydratase